MSPEPIKFLLVDDVEENLIALEALLRRDGLEVLKARSGSQALELLLVNEVALAFVDVQMPEMDGFELAELMRGSARTKHVPIIFVTAGARDPQRVFKGYESGAVDFLFKPVDPHVLRSKADVFFDLYRQRRELSHALRLNEMFVGILGHDLRNPLSAIVTGAHLLERQVKGDAQLRVLRRMMSAGDRMTDMIEQLLDLTRARLAGGLGFVRVRKSLDVGQLVARAVDELRVAHPERQVTVQTKGDCATSGDPQRLLQLFSNLAANAIQHGTPDRPVSADVEAGAAEIVVRVRNGGAIPVESMGTLFDPFRGRQNRSSTSRGLGLGLYICQQIALAHGGAVEVACDRERAETTFTARIPKRAVGPRVASRVDVPRHVLVVDDDETIRDSLRDALEGAGYAASTAASEEEALDLLEGADPLPDVVILDLVLPGESGGRIYRAMQTNPDLARIPVIVPTSNPDGAPPGAVVVPKPLTLERLLDSVTMLWRDSRIP